MMKKERNPKTREISAENENLTRKIGETYRYCKKQIDYFEYAGCVRENQKVYDDNRALIKLVDLSLENCTQTTRQIIRRQYLEISDTEWYRDYYSSSTYYRLRRKAVEEFLNSLNE